MAVKLRAYQRRILDLIGRENAIVKMPTGSGKTAVAAQLVADHLRGKNKQSLFLVPTQDLVDQQAQVVQRWCPEADVLQFTGGMADPQMTDARKICLVSTPKAFLHLQQRKPVFSWGAFSLVIFDEVHHVLKDHPYRHIALRMKEFLENDEHSCSIQVLGMSASLTYAVGDNAIAKTLARISHELSIKKMISPSVEELISGGYVSQHGRNVEIERAADSPEGLIPRTERKPHEMYRQFMHRVTSNKATAFTQSYWLVISELERKAKEENPDFESPLFMQKLSSWEEYAYRLPSTSKSIAIRALQHWYIGLRLLVQTWEEEQHLVLAWLHMNGAFDINIDESKEALQELKTQAKNPTDFLKMDRLRFHVQEKRKMKGDAFRCLVFTQQRITTVILSHFINSDPDLRALGIKADFVAAWNSKITPGISVTKERAKTSIENFRSGETNVIVSTSVLEEVRAYGVGEMIVKSNVPQTRCHMQGFDVPAANVVISYDHLKDSVELCQRFGRARREESSIVVLDERLDRPLEMLESVRVLQDTIAQEFDPQRAIKSSPEGEKTKQRSREQNANRAVLTNTSKCTAMPVAALNEYVKKTKAMLKESCSSRPPFVYTMSYHSILRSISDIQEQDSSKKGAKRKCAMKMLSALDKEMRRDSSSTFSTCDR